jgi:hypothetical protein
MSVAFGLAAIWSRSLADVLRVANGRIRFADGVLVDGRLRVSIASFANNFLKGLPIPLRSSLCRGIVSPRLTAKVGRSIDNELPRGSVNVLLLNWVDHFRHVLPQNSSSLLRA